MKLHDTIDVLIGGYLSRDAAEEDYNAVLDSGASLHGAAVVAKDLEGDVLVKQTDHMVRAGAEGVGAVGFAVGLFAPPLLATTAIGAAMGAAAGGLVHSKTTDKLGEQAGATIPLGGAGLIVAYSHSEAGKVEPAVTRAMQRAIGEAEGRHVKALKGALADAQRKMAAGPAAGFDWNAEYTYSHGVQAFIYGFPYLYLAQVRYKWTHDDRDPEHLPYTSVGRFWHARDVFDATFQDGGCPNNDTMYSVAWIDLTEEPVILSHPDMDDRYFSFQIGGMTSDNVDYVGQRTTGSAAGDFGLIGPDWDGELPEGVKATAPAQTPWIMCLGRTLVEGAEDVANVRELQSQYRLTPLSLWAQPGATAPERRDVLKPIEVAEDPLGPWKTLNALLVENPPPEEQAPLLKQFGTVGIGPGLDVETQPEVVKDNLLRAAGAGMQLIKQYFLSGDWATAVNGWRYPPPGYGRAGERDDFLLRSAGQALGGIIANDPPEAVYLVNMEDADGNKLAGDRRYELRFEHDTLPPVDSFWSLTMYKEDMNLVPNPSNRYAVGDRTAGLQTDPDGALTISIQAESPGDGQEANWLPCPPEGTWFVVLRLYLPHPEVVDASWECPPIQLVA